MPSAVRRSVSAIATSLYFAFVPAIGCNDRKAMWVAHGDVANVLARTAVPTAAARVRADADAAHPLVAVLCACLSPLLVAMLCSPRRPLGFSLVGIALNILGREALAPIHVSRRCSVAAKSSLAPGVCIADDTCASALVELRG